MVKIEILGMDLEVTDEDIQSLSDKGYAHVEWIPEGAEVMGDRDCVLIELMPDGGIGLQSYHHGCELLAPWDDKTEAIKEALSL